MHRGYVDLCRRLPLGWDRLRLPALGEETPTVQREQKMMPIFWGLLRKQELLTLFPSTDGN